MQLIELSLQDSVDSDDGAPAGYLIDLPFSGENREAALSAALDAAKQRCKEEAQKMKVAKGTDIDMVITRSTFGGEREKYFYFTFF